MIVDKTTRAGSRSLTGRRHYGLGWLPWLLILVLLVLAAAILVVVANLDEETEALMPCTRRATPRSSY
jgi:hypothetical protein